nr:MAG TPA: hypothetical protein [Caudoviricetes sp.]
MILPPLSINIFAVIIPVPLFIQGKVISFSSLKLISILHLVKFLFVSYFIQVNCTVKPAICQSV